MPDYKISFDGPLDIATGRSRKETNWKNKEVLWSELVHKLSATHRTAETHAAYVSSKKARQDEIKDIGGFVGGYLTTGRRKSGNVLHRQLITLDLDYATPEFWTDFELTFNCAAVVYSTHKHEPDSPRLRLIIPLDRPVMVDEYMAISRKIAGLLDIELFDPTTFQPERLMYWPSTSSDGIYDFFHQDGSWLSADSILELYHDWKDSSEWPLSERVDKILQKSMTKQGDPLEKPGLIGAFCRTYNIHEAIDKYLSEVYEACSIENRYTYLHGSTGGGLVVYDDKYAFSHHGTDPISGKLCNAFDLVRLHKFGLRDEDAREGTAPNRLPSYTAMVELASQDQQVKRMLVSEKITDARSDFQGLDNEAGDEENEDWKEKLDVDKKGNVYNSIDNVVIILENDPYFRGRIAYDDFEKCEVAMKPLPWRKVTDGTRRLVDKDDANIRHYFEKTYGITAAGKIKDAMQVLAQKTCFHPICDYLRSCEWDGKARVDSLLIDYQGACDDDYTRTITRKILVAAIARVFTPGVKFDHVLTLVGQQGLKKSTLLAKLGKQWFTDSFSTIKGKEAFEQLQGVWIVEIAELAALGRAEVEAIKHFITKRDDRYRVAFGHRVEKFPRQCIFVATTNKKFFLRDPTGDRRYWPVLVNETAPTKDVFKDLNDYEIDQIWGEAMHFYQKGETIYLPPSLEKIAKEMQRRHTEEHPWTGLIRQFLDLKITPDWHKKSLYERRAYLAQDDPTQEAGTVYRDRVCVLEIWQECIKGKDAIDERSANAIRDIMSNLSGWGEAKEQLRYGSYGQQRRGYKRTEIPEKVREETIKEYEDEFY